MTAFPRGHLTVRWMPVLLFSLQWSGLQRPFSGCMGITSGNPVYLKGDNFNICRCAWKIIVLI
jgi:hypothetical protein